MGMDFSAFTRPLPFDKGDGSIWTDEWISRGMLAAHLDPSTDAASRRPASIARICDRIDSLIPRRARVLDLGCGPGLYAEDLARRGHSVVGVDFSQRSIARARERAAAAGLAIEYQEADYLNAEIAGSFDCAIMIYCDIGTYGDEERDALLDRVRGLLVPGGWLAFDVYSERYAQIVREERRWDRLGEGNFWSPRPCVLFYEGSHFPDRGAFCRTHVILFEDDSRKRYFVWDRYYSEGEIRAILVARGFRDIRAKRDLVPPCDFSPYETLFMEARA